MTNKLAYRADVDGLRAVAVLAVIAVFDVFAAASRAGSSYCYPDNGSSFLYQDRDRFSSLSSRLLVEPFVDLLRSSGLLTRG